MILQTLNQPLKTLSNTTEVVRVLSLGAGVQSSALLVGYDRGKFPKPPHFAVFADTQAEPDRVYEWLERLRREVSIPILTASRGSILTELSSGKRFASIPFFLKNEKGKLGMARRQCTKEYKIEVVQQAIRKELGYAKFKKMKHFVQILLGISTDEVERMKPSRTPWIRNVYPLIQHNWSREACVQYLEGEGFLNPPKSSCVICPYRDNDSWRRLKHEEPHSFEKACEMDEQIRRLPRFKNAAYLHRSGQPLREVDLSETTEDGFGNECEGRCGV